MRQAEIDYESSEGGFKKLVRKVLPTLGTSGANHDEEMTKDV